MIVFLYCLITIIPSGVLTLCQNYITTQEEVERKWAKSSKIQRVQVDCWRNFEYFPNIKPSSRQVSYYNTDGNKIRFEEYWRRNADTLSEPDCRVYTTYEYRKDGQIENENRCELVDPFKKTVYKYLYNGNTLVEKRESELLTGLIPSRTYYQYDDLYRISEITHFGFNLVLARETLSTTEHNGTTTLLREKPANDDTTLILLQKEQYYYDETGGKKIVYHFKPKTRNDTITLLRAELYGYYEGNKDFHKKYNPQGFIIEDKTDIYMLRSDYVFNEKGNPILKIDSVLEDDNFIQMLIFKYSYEYFK